MPEHKKCSCKWVKCSRHGDCERCRAHHAGHPKYPRPFCERKTAAAEGRDLLQPIVPPLLDWFQHNARQLPWRDDPSPYRVWISEIMLQQTRVEAVKPYFERFVAALPDIAALAQVEDDRLMKLWEGLGYYSRARNLKKAAQLTMEQYGGRLPASYEELLLLPGIGPYTAGAVASIAFGLPVPAVDGNVLRVLSRLDACSEDIASAQVKKWWERRVAALLPADCPGAFNQALMELGATVCLPNGVPLCGKCPVQAMCKAFAQNTVSNYPVKAPKPPRKKEKRTVFVILRHGAVALRKRKNSGLLASMWELPNVIGWLSPEQAAEVLAQWEVQPSSIASLPAAKHIFTHQEWHMNGYIVHTAVKPDNPHFVWAEKEGLQNIYALPSAFRAFAAPIPGWLEEDILEN